ncbi:TlpA family protein disulfide reductase [Candidatus Desantisbacteria bacterium]|nr:TlpA family protein disulfide reductase [Candidatus Desantisbacteria bacterium]
MKNKIFLSLVFLLFFTYIPSEAKLITYNPKILNIPYSSWVAPFSYFKTASIENYKDNFIRLDKGELHGVKSGFIYEIKDLGTNTSRGKIAISVVSDIFCEGYFITPAQKIMHKDIAIFNETIESDLNPAYAMCLEPEVTAPVSLVENDLCYALLPEDKNKSIAKGQLFRIMDKNGQDTGLAEVLDISAQGVSIFKIIKKDKLIQEGFPLVSMPRNMSAWMNLGIELALTPDFISVGLYSFYRAYEFDKNNASILKGLEDISNRIGKIYEKKSNYNALKIYRQCNTITGGFKDEIKNILTVVKNDAEVSLGNKKILLAIKNLELLDKNPEIQNKLSICYNNEASSYYFEDNPDYQYYLFKQAYEINTENFIAAKNMVNLCIFQKNYKIAIEHLKVMKQNIFFKKAEIEWIAKKTEEIDRMINGLVYNYTFKTLSDSNITLASLKGNIVLLVKWTMKDENSREIIDYLPSFNNHFKGKPFKLLAVNSDPFNNQYINELKNFLQKYEGEDLNVVYTLENMENLFKLNSMPENVIIDKKGKIVYQDAGMLNDDLENFIEQLLK